MHYDLLRLSLRSKDLSFGLSFNFSLSFQYFTTDSFRRTARLVSKTTNIVSVMLPLHDGKIQRKPRTKVFRVPRLGSA